MGAALSVLWLVLPHSAGAQELPIAGPRSPVRRRAVLIAGRRPKPPSMLHAAIAVDTFVVSLALVATRDPGSVYAF